MMNLKLVSNQRPPTDAGEAAPTPDALVAAALTRCPLPARSVALRAAYEALRDEREQLHAALRAARQVGQPDTRSARSNVGQSVDELERKLYGRGDGGSPSLDERMRAAKDEWRDAARAHLHVVRSVLRPFRRAAGERLAAALETVRQEAALLRAHDDALLRLGDDSPDVTPFVDGLLAPIDAAARRAQRGAD